MITDAQISQLQSDKDDLASKAATLNATEVALQAAQDNLVVWQNAYNSAKAAFNTTVDKGSSDYLVLRVV